MRALTLESVPSTPAVTEVDTPRPQAGELLVKVAAASLNGIDIATAAGYTQAFMEHRYPLVLGQDFAGTVEALGEGVDGFAVGDAVFGVVLKPFLGAYCWPSTSPWPPETEWPASPRAWRWGTRARWPWRGPLPW